MKNRVEIILKTSGDKIGITCRRCSHTKHYLKSQWSYECKKCKSSTSLRSGTIMQSSNLSFLIWYKTMFLITATKKGFSSKKIHMTEKLSEQTTKETLKWVHIEISNTKRNFVGNYHKIKKKYLQLYLNEFVCELNRRYFRERIFDRLLIANIVGYD